MFVCEISVITIWSSLLPLFFNWLDCIWNIIWRNLLFMIGMILFYSIWVVIFDFQSGVFRSTVVVVFLAMLTIVVFLWFMDIFGLWFGLANDRKTFIFQLLDLVLLELTDLLWRWWGNAVASLSSVAFRLLLLVLGFVLSSLALRSVSASSLTTLSWRSASLSITFWLVGSVTILTTSFATLSLFSCTFLRSITSFSFLSRFLNSDGSSFLLNNHFRSFLGNWLRLLFFLNRLWFRFSFNLGRRLLSLHFR